MPCKDKPETCGFSGSKVSGSGNCDPCLPAKEEFGGACGKPFTVAGRPVVNEYTGTLVDTGRYVLYRNETSGGGIFTSTMLDGDTEVTLVFPRTADCGIVLDGVNMTKALVGTVEANLAAAGSAFYSPGNTYATAFFAYGSATSNPEYPVLPGTAPLITNIQDGKAPNVRLNLINHSTSPVYFVASKECEPETIEHAARSVAARPNETLKLVFDVVTRQWLVC